MDNVVRLWLRLISWKKFSVLHKVVHIMLVSSTTGSYRNDFIDDNFNATSYNVVVRAVNAVRSWFGLRGVSSSCRLDYGKITGCNEAMSMYVRLVDLTAENEKKEKQKTGERNRVNSSEFSQGAL